MVNKIPCPMSISIWTTATDYLEIHIFVKWNLFAIAVGCTMHGEFIFPIEFIERPNEECTNFLSANWNHSILVSFFKAMGTFLNWNSRMSRIYSIVKYFCVYDVCVVVAVVTDDNHDDDDDDSV